MDRASYLVWSLLGAAAALAVFFLLRAKRRAFISPVVWWLCLMWGAIASMYGVSHSISPSFATRITAVGKAYNCVERRHGKDTYFSFRFVPDGGEPVNIETLIIIPGWATPTVFDGRSLRVVYLQNSKRLLRNEAIDIEILTGTRAGFHDSFDARPFGKWLGVPVGAALAV